MIRGLFRRSPSEAVVRRLYGALVEAARRPALYAAIGVPDTFEGRFESLTLHAALVLRRLQAGEPPGPALAQDLVDTTFAHFDRTLREMGVGDTSVPKRMKQMAEAFYGRCNAYEQALAEDETALVATLARNTGAGDAEALARYVAAGVEALRRQPVARFVDGVLPFAELVVAPAEPAGVAP